MSDSGPRGWGSPAEDSMEGMGPRHDSASTPILGSATGPSSAVGTMMTESLESLCQVPTLGLSWWAGAWMKRAPLPLSLVESLPESEGPVGPPIPHLGTPHFWMTEAAPMVLLR